MSIDLSDREICRDFLRNACSRGSRCKYQHKLPVPVSKSGELEFCRDFQNGTCKRTACKYIHASRAEEEQYRQSGSLPMQIQNLGLSVVNPTTSFPLPTLPVESPPEVADAFSAVNSNSISAADICRDFLRGSCNRGDRCKFRHVNPADIASSISALTQPPSPSPMITDQLGQFLQPAGSIPLPPNLSSVSPFSILPPGVQFTTPPFTGNSLLASGLQCSGLLPSLPILPNIQPVSASALLPFSLAPYPDASMLEKEIDRSGSPSPVHSSESGFGTSHKPETAQVAPPDGGKSNAGGKRKRTNSGSLSLSSPTMKNQRNTFVASSVTPLASSGRNGNITNRSHVDSHTQTATQTSPSSCELDRTPSPVDTSAAADKRHASNQTQSSGNKLNSSANSKLSSSSSSKKYGSYDFKYTSDNGHPSDDDNLDLKRRVDQLMKQCSELVAANELLQEQNALLRASCDRRREGEWVDAMPRGTCVMAVTNQSALDAAASSMASSAAVAVGIPVQMPLPVATLPSSAMVPVSLVSEALTNCISPGVAAVSAVASHPLLLTSSPLIHTGTAGTLQETISVPMQVSVQAMQPMQTMLPLHSFGSPQLPLQKLAIAATAAPLPTVTSAALTMEAKEIIYASNLSDKCLIESTASTAEASACANAPRYSSPQSSVVSSMTLTAVSASSGSITSSIPMSSSAPTASFTMTAIPATLPQIATVLPVPVATSLPAISALPVHTLPTTVTLTLPLHAVPVSSIGSVLRAQSHAVLDVASAKH